MKTTASSAFRSVAVDVNGLAFHMMAPDGADDSAPLVLVHGLGLSHRYMMPTAERLASGYAVYVPDLPGFGDSGHPEGVPDMAGLADALADWMEAIGLSRAAFLGNSQACQVIAQLAIRHPARVSRAVLQGPTAPPRDRSWVRQFIRWRMNWRFNTPGLDPISFADYRRSGYLRVLRTFQHSLDDHIEDHLPRIAAPTLIVRGECDPICRGDWARELAKMAPNGSFVEIPGVAHTLVYTSPVELANVTRAFLGEESPCPDRFSAGASWWDEAPLGSRR